jgi:hypothetical protein
MKNLANLKIPLWPIDVSALTGGRFSADHWKNYKKRRPWDDGNKIVIFFSRFFT